MGAGAKQHKDLAGDADQDVRDMLQQVMSSMANLHARFDELESKVQSIAADTEQIKSGTGEHTHQLLLDMYGYKRPVPASRRQSLTHDGKRRPSTTSTTSFS